jgi:hypothetical protein
VILVLEKGRLSRMGKHEDLVHVPGIYRETALLQLMDLTESAGIGNTLKEGQRAVQPGVLIAGPGRVG